MYLILDIPGNTATVVTLKQAARIALLDEDDILWTLEEFGICETDDYAVVDYAEPN